MRVLFWYCSRFHWVPTVKTLEDAPASTAAEARDAVVAFIHVEPADVVDGSPAQKKLLKNAKWLARKWETDTVVLHSFTHLGEVKADAGAARELLERAAARLEDVDYTALRTPYGYFNDLSMDAPGHPLARIYKEF
ncbi:MAG: threonyl-tRNA synthetase editing domain-containing protein [Gammaproteobacteria bacterium]